EHFLRQQSSTTAEVSPSLMSDLLSHDWPGNVRELQSAANRLAAGLAVFNDQPEGQTRKNSLSAQVAAFEKDLIEAALSHNQGSIKRTMLDLDVPRKTLYDKMTRHKLRRDSFQS
ncbi:MAG: helix-turn-helix domain-containing protein, partial [Pseudomonadota bacterium]